MGRWMMGIGTFQPRMGPCGPQAHPTARLSTGNETDAVRVSPVGSFGGVDNRPVGVLSGVRPARIHCLGRNNPLAVAGRDWNPGPRRR